MYPNTSNHSYKEDFTIKPHNFIELTPKIKLILNDENLHKIMYLCKNIPREEWSGVLFYSVEGSIKKPETMVLTIQDILPLDKGTAGYTSYSLDNRFVEYMMENEEAMDWKVGHIHSHNVMGVFFSGTDNAELKDNAPNHNFYLSMIVNNYMDMIAKIAIQGTSFKSIPKVPVIALDEEGEKYTIEKKDFKVGSTFIYTHDCEIESNVKQVIVNDIFGKKVEDILKPKPVPVKTTTYVAPASTNSKAPTYTPPSRGDKQTSFDFSKKKGVEGDFDYKKIMESYNKVDSSDIEDYANHRLTYENMILESFGRRSLMEELEQEKMIDFDREVMDIMDEFEEEYKSTAEVAKEFLEEYLGIYSEYIPSNTNEDFVFHTYRVIEVLEEFSVMYPKYIKPVITLAQRTVERFIEDNIQKK